MVLAIKIWTNQISYNPYKYIDLGWYLKNMERELFTNLEIDVRSTIKITVL